MGTVGVAVGVGETAGVGVGVSVAHGCVFTSSVVTVVVCW
jgi:hypothetical protein